MAIKRQKVDPRADPTSPLSRVDEALAKVEGAGQFCASGAMSEFPNPSLYVPGVGDILLPMTDATAKHVIEQCRLAPYGHGEQTLVDPAVRNTWELDATQFTIQNPAWTAFIQRVTRTCCDDLGIDVTTVPVDAKPYKLLVYEVGGKFDRHQDSEKERGMFGTLVVVLPTVFTGGELVVHPPHDKGDPWTWVPSARSRYDVQNAAFYGDCGHEVKAVTSGYRVCLTYNLVTAQSKDVPKVEVAQETYAELKQAFDVFCGRWAGPRDWHSSYSAACRFVYVLQHQYTSRGLDFGLLKGRDRAVARALTQYCSESGGAFKLYLCRAQYYRHTEDTCLDQEIDDDEEEDDSDDDGTGDPHENKASEGSEKDADESDGPVVYGTGLRLELPWLEYGSTVHNTAVNGVCESAFEARGSLEYEVCPLGYFDKIKFDGERHIGFTGNEGNHEEQWYRTAALVLQPVYGEWIMLKNDAKRSVIADTWKSIARSRPSYLQMATDIFFEPTIRFHSYVRWSSRSRIFRDCLEVAVETKDVGVLTQMFLSCESTGAIKNVDEMIEKIGRVTFFDEVVKRLGSLSTEYALKLVRSIVTSVTKIDDVAQMVEAIPWPMNPTSDADVDDLVSVLKLARTVSESHTRRFLLNGEPEQFVNAIAPAFDLIWKSEDAVGEWKNVRCELIRTIQDMAAKYPKDSKAFSHLQRALNILQASE